MARRSPDPLGGFSEASVLVVGDVMLDEYLWGEAERISPEAPVPVVDFRRRSYVLGGAANVAANVAALSGRATLVGMVGEDDNAAVLRSELDRQEIGGGVIASPERPTTTKTRIVANSQQVLRLDHEDRAEISESAAQLVLQASDEHLAGTQCMLISDYGKGVVTPEVSLGLIDAAENHGIPVVVDPKGRDFRKYRGASVVTPNAREVSLAVMALLDVSLEPHSAAPRLVELLEGTAVLMTQGAEGMTLFRPDSQDVHIDPLLRRVFDVTGAGDTVAASLALALGSGIDLEEGARIANVAASLAVSKVGTAAVTFDELKAEYLGS